MARKLKVELEVETEKAKRKIVGMADGASGASPVDSAAQKTARELEKAAKGARDLGDAAGRGSVNMKAAVRAFGGLAIGMSAQYSARYLEEGSTARNAVEYGAGALQGASVGMMAGPWGAAAGAALGLGKTFFDKSGQNAQALKDFETSERRYREAQGWKGKFDAMTGKGDYEAELARLREAEAKIAETVRQFTEKGAFGKANHQIESLNINRQRQAQLDAAIKTADDKSRETEQRTMSGAVDALSRVGGAFAGSGTGDALLRTSQEQVSILRSIERKTGGGATWQ